MKTNCCSFKEHPQGLSYILVLNTGRINESVLTNIQMEVLIILNRFVHTVYVPWNTTLYTVNMYNYCMIMENRNKHKMWSTCDFQDQALKFIVAPTLLSFGTHPLGCKRPEDDSPKYERLLNWKQ
jgi:hypothetical protein